MREADRVTIEDIGIPSLVLMENAGRQVVAAMEAAYEEQLGGRVGVLCGRGNNGGDGFVVARTLLQRGVDTAVFVIGALADVRGDARINLDILGRLGVTVVEIGDEQSWELHFSEISECTLLVDAIFGTGLKSPVAGMLETVIADVNASDIPIVSINLPSGMSADTPHLIGDCITASMTVTLAVPKVPLVLPPAEAHAGDVVIADIGIPYEVVDGLEGQHIELLTPEQLRDVVEPRAADSHKGDFGRVTVVAGSLGKTGAAYLTAMGALRSGAGLVTVATPSVCLPIVASMAPEFMTEPLGDPQAATVSPAAIERVLELTQDVIACGPGIGRSREAGDFMRALLERATVPLVLDADALSVMADDPGRVTGRDDRDVIITPHPGEMARLVGMPVEDVQANRIEVASNFATTHRVYVVLKGHRTLLATPEGRVYINPTGNPGMATGGTGDVLTGMIAAWLAQLLDAEAACRLAVFLHGAAGDLAEAESGQVAMTATDLLDHLGDALTGLLTRGSRRGSEPDVGSVTITHSEAETAAVARTLAGTLRAGDVLLLTGNLGAGKTAFVRGLAEGLGIDANEVSSPTFTLVHEYGGGRLTLYHVDLYRLDRTGADDLGLEEMSVGNGVLAIEWPDRLRHRPDGATSIAIEIVDDTTRRIVIDPDGVS